jgi:hypothetical protein
MMGFISFAFILGTICFVLYERTTDTGEED